MILNEENRIVNRIQYLKTTTTMFKTWLKWKSMYKIENKIEQIKTGIEIQNRNRNILKIKFLSSK